MIDLVVCSVAEAEYADALCWYAERSVSAAERFDAEFDQAMQTIASDPERFPKCDERHHYYLMCRFPYQIIYRQEATALRKTRPVVRLRRPPAHRCHCVGMNLSYRNVRVRLSVA